jgi:hypothetical protein
MAVGGDSTDEGGCTVQLAQPLHVLDAGLVVLIDRYLAGIGGYGEVRLKVVQGRVRFVEVAVSVDVQKVTEAI